MTVNDPRAEGEAPRDLAPGQPMTPGQHYLLAGFCLDEAVTAADVDTADYLVRVAQVHATLACTTGSYSDAYRRWKEELSV